VRFVKQDAVRYPVASAELQPLLSCAGFAVWLQSVELLRKSCHAQVLGPVTRGPSLAASVAFAAAVSIPRSRIEGGVAAWLELA